MIDCVTPPLYAMESVAGIQNFLEFVVQRLADRPETAKVTRRENGGRHIFDLAVDEDDIPRLIGHSGSTVTALRNIACAAGERHGVAVGVEVVDG